jgi:hypothetical protein
MAVALRGRMGSPRRFLEALLNEGTGQAISPGASDEHLYRFGIEMICEAVAALIARNQRKK